MRKKIIAGNWKMNKTFQEAEDLVTAIADALEESDLNDKEVVLCPPFPYLEMATDIAAESLFRVGAQNIHDRDAGAFTGEVSAAMLASLEVEYCIIGHSERRKYFQEDGAWLAFKVDAAIRHGIRPIFCCGEVLPEREAGRHFGVVQVQLEASLFHLSPEQFSRVVIAYEPVWAIGTGVNATPEQAQEMHAWIRKLISEKYGAGIAADTTILYGGSCNSKNAASLFANPDVDGGLIGGASLEAGEFMLIVNAL
ncbi:MAG TPA: triose-phosphate isomerase [Bacteroidales bacterium]|nr:triose-phosphate isomerase [Bacteroidales bacterium]